MATAVPVTSVCVINGACVESSCQRLRSASASSIVLVVRILKSGAEHREDDVRVKEVEVHVVLLLNMWQTSQTRVGFSAL